MKLLYVFEEMDHQTPILYRDESDFLPSFVVVRVGNPEAPDDCFPTDDGKPERHTVFSTRPLSNPRELVERVKLDLGQKRQFKPTYERYYRKALNGFRYPICG